MQQLAEQQTEWEQRCRSLLACWPLPEVANADPYQLGVFYSRRADVHRANQSRPPYVPRAGDGQLALLLQSQPLVLVKGQSRAGKSRTAFEVAARELGDWRLLAPTDRAALAALAELDPLPGQGERVLVWLDDLDKYLAVEGARGLDTALLGRWLASDPPLKVLATIRLEEHGRVLDTPGELGRRVRELLNRFDPGAMTLPVAFDDPSEQVAIAELYPGEHITGGLAEHLAAVHELVDRFEVGQASVPEGAGVVLAAVDCRRAGLDRPVSRAELAALLPLYLKQLRPLFSLQEGDVDRGLGWATEPVGRTAALLVPDPDALSGTFRVADPIIDHVERYGHKLVQSGAWERLLTFVSPREALDVGFAAYSRGELAAAKAAYQQAMDSNHRHSAPAAAISLGFLLEEQGDVDGAKAAYQWAIGSKHRDAAPAAAVNLGLLLAKLGDVDGAKAAYQQAIDSNHLDTAPWAAVNLGLLLAELGEVDDAMAVYQWAIDSGHPDEAPTAAIDLGNLLEELGDVDGAKAAYRWVIDSKHPGEAPVAAVNLGLLHGKLDEVDGAKAAYQHVIDLYPTKAARAAFNLGRLLEEQGDAENAKVAYQRASDSTGHPAIGAAARRALYRLGVSD
jgi:tetratricopeptide (TPR) repeat protein